MMYFPPGSQVSKRALLLLVTALPLCGVAHAAGKKRGPVPSSPAPAPLVPGVAHLRIWKADLPGIKSVDFTLRPATGAGISKVAVRRIASVGAGYQLQPYIDVPAGTWIIESFKPGIVQSFASVSADLAAGSYLTLLLTAPEAGKTVFPMELIHDGESSTPTPAGGACFSLRNMTPGVHDVRVTVGDVVSAQFGAAGGGLRLTGLTPGIYAVRATGKDATDKPFEWTTEGDFNRFRRQTLLIYPDPYGRLRPRLTLDGPALIPEPPKAGAQS